MQRTHFTAGYTLYNCVCENKAHLSLILLLLINLHNVVFLIYCIFFVQFVLLQLVYYPYFITDCLFIFSEVELLILSLFRLVLV